MDKLPHELLDQIISIAWKPPAPTKFHKRCKCARCVPPRKLAPYTVLSRTWRAVLERVIWKELRVNKFSELKTYTASARSIPGEHGVSRNDEDAYRRERVRYIRHLTWIWWPKWIPGVEASEVPEIYNGQFQAKMRELFTLLHSWGGIRSDIGMQLSLDVRSSEFIPLPSDIIDELETNVHMLATLDARGLWERAQMSYTPRLSAEVLQDLPVLSYITAFGITEPDENDASPSVFMGLLNRFLNVKRVYGGEGRVIPRGALRALADSRNEIAEYLPLVPASIETFEYQLDYERELAFNPAHNAANYLNAHCLDGVSIGFRGLSMRLRKLHLDHVRINNSVFWPDAAEGVDTEALYWPVLEELLIKEVPPYTADGEWILENDPDKWYNNFDISLDDDPDQDWQYEGGYYGPRGPIRADEANKMYTAMGLAAQRMPRLRILDFSFRAENNEGGPDRWLRFEKDVGTGKAKLEIVSDYGMQVEEGFLDAWRVREAGEEKVREMREGGLGWQKVYFETWPPGSA
ncbi:hypothetical protein BDW74DRAFT_178045 [Aspergillus multicolor]|uniref:uncharacterized protein n=1 Tax=Aspergillus multicolor TaxID=41759 RepID=UPI003CCE2B32